MDKLLSNHFSASQSRNLLEDPFQEHLWISSVQTPEALADKEQSMADKSRSPVDQDQISKRSKNHADNKAATKAILLAQRMLDNNKAEKAEILCRQALSIACDGHVMDGIAIKLMDSLARQNKIRDISAIFQSIEAVEGKPWALYFGIIEKLVSKDYSSAIHLLKYACTEQNLQTNAIDRRLPLLACAISMLSKDSNSLLEFSTLIGYSLSINRVRDLLCFSYLAPSLLEILDAIKSFETMDNPHNLVKICTLLIGPAFGRWNVCGLVGNSILTLAECESIMCFRMTKYVNSLVDQQGSIAYLSLMHYLDDTSPYCETLELYQLLSRNYFHLEPALHELAESLKAKLSHGYQYNATDSISFYLQLGDDRMPQLFDKISSDYATFNVVFNKPEYDSSFTPYELSDLVPVAEINIDHCKLFSSSIVNLIRDAKNLVANSRVHRIFLLPWLKAGGADKVSLDWINYCSSIDDDKSLVLFTENSISEWQYRLSGNARVLRTADYISDYSLDQQAYALALLVQYLRPEIVHNINSNLGYIMAEKHAKSLVRLTNLACHIFCNDRNAYGQWDGYGFRHNALIYSYFKYVFSDNRSFLDDQIESLRNFAKLKRFPDQICTHIYVPTQLPESEWAVQEPHYRCFWTGRLDNQKRLDILAQIASRLTHIKFDVYGSIMLDGNEHLISRIATMTNVNMCGRYDSFYNLSVSDYDFYIMTSEWEGIPNTLLEAASFGLPIVAPLVGGIHEVLDVTTGFPVMDYTAIDEYCQAINLLYSDFSDARQRGASARDRIRKNHSFTNMKERLLATSYIHARA